MRDCAAIVLLDVICLTLFKLLTKKCFVAWYLYTLLVLCLVIDLEMTGFIKPALQVLEMTGFIKPAPQDS